MEKQTESDRRWFERVRCEGAAAVLDFGYLGIVYELEDLSLGGARLRGHREPPETTFDILLHVSNRYVERRARKVWDDRDANGTLGIEFEAADSKSFVDWSDTADDDFVSWSSLAPTRNSNRSAALVVDAQYPRTSILSHSLSALGFDAVEASTPLAAIEAIERDEPSIDVVFIAPAVSGCEGAELASFVADTYPRVRRVLMASKEELRGALHGVERLLLKPWSLASIKAVLDSLDIPYIRNRSMENSFALP